MGINIVRVRRWFLFTVLLFKHNYGQISILLKYARQEIMNFGNVWHFGGTLGRILINPELVLVFSSLTHCDCVFEQ